MKMMFENKKRMNEDYEDSFEIYWDDLTKECQERLFDFLGGENGNYDVFPIATIESSDF